MHATDLPIDRDDLPEGEQHAPEPEESSEPTTASPDAAHQASVTLLGDEDPAPDAGMLDLDETVGVRPFINPLPVGTIVTTPDGRQFRITVSLSLTEVGDVHAPPAIQPLPTGSVVAAPDGKQFRILDPITSDQTAGFFEYEAGIDGDPRRVWLQEAFSEAAAARLRHQAEVLGDLSCPMFPRVLACFRAEGRSYLALEGTSGKTLAEAVAEGKLSVPRVLSVLAQVAFALSHLHERGWVHLGLRSGRVMLSKPVRVLDLSYATRPGQEPAGNFYHAGYSPPELVNRGPVDERADIYAVGALLFHAVTGQPIAETGAELSTWEPPDPVAGVPQILHRCLGAPETRFSTMKELHAALLQLARRYAPTVTYSVGACTSVGLEPTRIENQDAYLHVAGELQSEQGRQSWVVLGVADGMGGMQGGEVASDAAVKTIQQRAVETFSLGKSISAQQQTEMLRDWAIAANTRVCDRLAEAQLRGGSTLLCACLVDDRLTVAHVGDCRLYLLRGNEARLLTRDHSVAMALALQDQIDMEQVPHHPDRGNVTRSLGDRQPLPPYFVDTLEEAAGAPTLALRPGDVLLLCSDGVWEPVAQHDMLQIVGRYAPDLKKAADALVETALRRGGPDNATVVLARLDVG
jgi:protein phosphatase